MLTGGADERDGHDAGMLRLVAPGMAGAVLDDGVARPHDVLLAVVELEPELAGRKRRAARPRVTVSAVVAAAIEIVDRHGVDALTIRAVADACGLTESLTPS